MSSIENEHPAERRIREKRELEELRARNAELEAQLAASNEDADDEYQRIYGAPEQPYEQQYQEHYEIPADEIAAHQRVASAATPLAPPPTAASELQALRYQALHAPASQLHPSSELYARTLDAIRKAGLEVVSGELVHDGTFAPLDS